MKTLLYIIIGSLIIILFLSSFVPRAKKFLIYIPSFFLFIVGFYFIVEHFIYINSGDYVVCLTNPDCMNEAPMLAFGIIFVFLGFGLTGIILFSKFITQQKN